MELFPVLVGLAAGGLLAVSFQRWRVWRIVGAAVVLGLLATVLSGEWAMSWLFLVVDISLVAVSALIGGSVVRELLRRRVRP